MDPHPYDDLLAEKLLPREFARRVLALMEADLREEALIALGEWEALGVPSAEVFAATARLQRPSWGTWNGLVVALGRARRACLRTAGAAERTALDRAAYLSALLEALETRLSPDRVSALGPLAELVRGEWPSDARLRHAVGLPIALRNRIAHDAPEDEAWWAAAAAALEPLVRLHAEADPRRALVPPAEPRAPWLFREDGILWAFNGIEADLAVRYVSRRGGSRSVPERSHDLLLALERLSGRQGAREGEVRTLLARFAPEGLKGVLLGDVLVGRLVGEGAFATVHRGLQLGTGRPVAVKVLRDGMSEESRLRFRQEATQLARFDHPRVVRVLGYGEATWSTPRDFSLHEEEWFRRHFEGSAPKKSYIVLEWIDGGTLEDLFRRTRKGIPAAPVPELARLMRQAASAIGAVHAAGLVHRDVKPENLMLSEGAVKLMDFGIARSRGESRTIATQTGVSIGTPAYMSPEQIRAADVDAEVGPATDVYSLCATFYELFTGTRFFDHDDVEPRTVETRKLAGELPVSPRRRAQELPWEVETILLGGLETERGDRYASIEDLGRDLDHFLRDEPIEYRRPSLARRLALGYRRNRTAT